MERRNLNRHPNESAVLMDISVAASAPREDVRVERLIVSASLPIADPISNAWVIRLNNNVVIPARSTVVYNTNLQFYLPRGVMGVISEHPYNHGQNPFVETLYFHEHLPFGGVKLRLTNHLSGPVNVDEGHFIGLLFFQSSLRVELGERPPSPRDQRRNNRNGHNNGQQDYRNGDSSSSEEEVPQLVPRPRVIMDEAPPPYLEREVVVRPPRPPRPVLGNRPLRGGRPRAMSRLPGEWPSPPFVAAANQNAAA